MNSFKQKLFNISDKFESSRSFKVVRSGLTAIMPFILISAMALMLTSLPIPAYQNFITSALNGHLYHFLSLVYSCGFDMLSVFMVIIISYKYASTYTDDSKELITLSLIAMTSYCALNGDISLGKVDTTFDSTQLFSAVITAVITGKMYKYLRGKSIGKNSYLTLNSASGFGTAVRTIFPSVVIILTFALTNFLITIIFDVHSIQGLFAKVIQALFVHTGDGYLSMLLYSFLVQFLWFFGIHGSNMLEPIIQSNYMEVGEHIFSKSFYDTFVNLGGSGVCLCVLLGVLLVARTKEIRYVAKLGAFPVIFNISEILSMGIPLLFNPIFFIPFLTVPIINGAISYFATYIGLIPVVDTTVTWTTPVLFSGYYATGSISGAVLQLVLLVIGTLIYIPFIKMYEEKLCIEAKERVRNLVDYMGECEKLNKDPDFLKRSDSLGQTAKVLAHDLKDALKDNSITFYYQPQTNDEDMCIGCEALIRWNHPMAGFIYPPLIIELAKETDSLDKIDELLIDNACGLIKELNSSGTDNLKVSINVTVASILQHDLEEMISKAVVKHDVDPSSLWIELTENEAFTNITRVVDVLAKLQADGHRLLIDDFGMGHTSLKYLQANKFNVVKLDGSLTKDIHDNEVNQKIIHSIVELGVNLGFDIIAEFVETYKQRDKLLELGCNYYQGYLYSKPLTKDDFIQYYKDHTDSNSNI